MASTTLGKRTRASRQQEDEPVLSLDSPAKRLRRNTVRDIKQENNDIQESHENQENEQPESEAEATPTKCFSRRTSIASTVKSAKVAPVTPSTPRHYDVFAKGTTTPRHRVMSVGRLSRRMTPQTPLTPSTAQTVYHQARQLFSRSAEPGQLIGRDDERAKLLTFLERCTTARPGGCLYVSGPPGTGKSAMVKTVTDETATGSESIRKAYINCMSIRSSKDLYATLLEELGGGSDMSESRVDEALQKLFLCTKTDVFLVVLDEVDHILTLDPESLHRVFEWSLQPSSRLTLVGIANALDLTDRFLPRLKSRNLKPELLPFLPYTAPQVKRIITERLKTLAPEGSDPNFIPFFHPAAIELCSRKVSSQTGDLRRAFEVCRRALDLVESETRMKHENEAKDELLQMTPSRKPLGENRNLASSPACAASKLAKSLAHLTVTTAPRVTIAHLNKVTAAAFSNGPVQRLKTLNLQQKAALCSLVAIEKRNRAAAAAVSASAPSTPSSTGRSRAAGVTTTIAAPTVKQLYEAYCALCKSDSLLHPLSSSEFREVVGSLETLSLIAPVEGRNGSFGSLASSPSAVGVTPKRARKKKDVFGNVSGGLVADERRVASCVGEREVEAAIEGMGAGILRGILSGEALD
ncbi:hypothetical protein VTJ49DRAFT_2334 [Mycothermus thermophilus]|uniref:Cell division control protein n=1 Tax=Humicola insolens TaxID=85995 RepID=A0ABR3VRB8_HUMIN